MSSHDVVELLLLLLLLSLGLHGLQLLAQCGHLLLEYCGSWGHSSSCSSLWSSSCGSGLAKHVQTTGGAGLLPLEPGPRWGQVIIGLINQLIKRFQTSIPFILPIGKVFRR
jgi:hypothetical protein